MMSLVDLKQAWRRLMARPGATLAPVTLLATGIGLTTAMFAVLDTLVLTPVPFESPGELAAVNMGSDRGGSLTVSPAVLRAWRDSPAFAAVESANTDTAVLEAGETVVARPVAWVTPGLFAMLGGVSPVRGRLFEPNDGRAGAEDRVLLSEALWRGLFDSDSAIVGRRVRIDGEPVVVAGVLPRDFRFPAWDTALWRPISFDAFPPSRANRQPMVHVRFAGNIPRLDAARLATDAARAADATNVGLRLQMRPLVSTDIYDRRAVPLLVGGVGFVFLVLCINVCGLLLGRFTARRREFSICSALGASSGRLMRQAFVETSVLCGLGAVGGIALAWTLIQLFRAFVPESNLMQTLNPPDLDTRALAATIGASVVATVAVGIWPAWVGGHVDAGQSLRAAEQSGTETPAGKMMMRALLVAEMALACTLLVTATLLVRSFVNLVHVDRGLETAGVVAASMSLPKSAFPTTMARAAAVRSVEETLRQLPGVERVAWSYGLPPDQVSFSSGTWIPDTGGESSSSMTGVSVAGISMTVDRYNVGADFFDLYGIPLAAGRTFGTTDTDRHVVVGERLARTFWPDLGNPTGRTFSLGKEQFEVIGVAREIRYPSLESDVDRPEMYQKFGGAGSYSMVSIRCRAKCPDQGLIRQRLLGGPPGVRVVNIQPVENPYLEQLSRPRAAAGLGVVFATIALVVVGGGLFFVLNLAVGRRRRELGIRVALGASPAEIRRLVWREGLVVALAGGALGTLGALALTRAIAALQYGVTIADPATWAIVLGVLTCVAILASWYPVRDAMRADPKQLLTE